ncbi:2f44ac25-7603-4cb4-9f58-b4e4d99f4ad8 [Sclerotinia trifoliorum]|uniref:tRNA (guanine(26)-N(2))-dimethyltransferase n=1 Tax=Sclerotinia trifoliorum TaxID=28548 RepID=A0A8H2ZR98_9HELO|nr:2f44ac25-7603-4cb4-9f58-b4e4d99f4ad8 [Sclerotinia trifoliorum]
MRSISTSVNCFRRTCIIPQIVSNRQTISIYRFFSASAMDASLPDITVAPAADQHILHDGKEYTTVKEGLAHILIPAEGSKVPQTTPKGQNQVQSVFYNPIQQFNRDLSVLAIKAYGESILEKKRKIIERDRQKNAAKKEKKRAAEEENDGPRKAGKLDSAGEAVELPLAVAKPENTIDDKEIESKEGETISQNGGTNIRVSMADGEPNNRVTTEKDEVPENKNEQEPTKPANPINPRFKILDALSATGLRALRYAQEIPFATSITANDLLPAATKTIELNVKHNKLENKINAVTGNALTHMYSLIGDDSKDGSGSKKYDVIDLDPYGTAAPFLDAAVQAVRDDGGLLCVTCTDAGVWASNGYPEKAYSLYGGVTVKGQHSHEGGLRLILHSIATSAARYGLAMEPLLSLSIDFYARVFVRIYRSPSDVKFLAGKTMMVYNCDTGCGAWTTQMVGKNKLVPNKNGIGHFWKHVYSMGPSAGENCSHCGMRTHLAGPMYGGPLHQPEFVQRILNDLPNVSKDTYHTTARIEGMLTLALEENLPPTEDLPDSPTDSSKTGKNDPAALDHYPFFFIPSMLAKVIHCVTPHENALRGALRHLGYRVTRSHTKGGSIKTDAPWDVIWEIMREWARQKCPPKEGAIKKNTAGWYIIGLDKTDTSTQQSNIKDAPSEVEAEEKDTSPAAKKKLEIVFDERLGMEKDTKKIVRYQVNPRENWGPMNRASGHA